MLAVSGADVCTGLYSCLVSILGADPFTVLLSYVEESWKSLNTSNLWLGRQNHCQKLASQPIRLFIFVYLRRTEKVMYESRTTTKKRMLKIIELKNRFGVFDENNTNSTSNYDLG